jgi:EAL domain-containing protein (putative c-di-GMP-specific phosphodiesterase class I)
VAELLERFGLPGELLVLELTEQQFERPTASLLRWFETLRPSGVQLAIDDFGTGYNSLTHVTDLSVDVIKLDRQFVSAMHHDTRAMAVVQAVIGMSQALDLAVVAEGGEIRQHAAELRDLGCRWGQGFLWSAALPPEDVELLLSGGQAGLTPGGPGLVTDVTDVTDAGGTGGVTDLRGVGDTTAGHR